MKAVIPISKKCHVCDRKKLLIDFEFDDNTKDKHANICKECLTGNALCPNCVGNQILDTAEPMIDLLIDLVKDGMEIPPYVVKKISNLALLAGAKISCESCGESLK